MSTPTQIPGGKVRSPALPFVLVNMAITADGKIATANRAVSSFSSARDRRHLLALRATADAVMCGARTADLNRITLGTGAPAEGGAALRRLRIRRGLGELNLLILVSGSGTLDPRAHVFTRRFSPILVLTTGRASARNLARLRNVADVVRICGAREINWRATLLWLRNAWGVRRLLCEGGGELNDALFRAGLVSEVHLTLCPKVFGGRCAPTLADGIGAARLAHAAGFGLKSVRRAPAAGGAGELFLVFRAKRRPVASEPAGRSATGAT